MVRAEAAPRLRPRQLTRRRPLTWLDVFTAEPFTGNGLAVVHDAGGVESGVMHAFARETRLSETSFLQPPEAEGADYLHRIWMTRGEIPFAGHPSLGAAVAHVRAGGRPEASVVQQTAAGLQPIDVEVSGPRAHATMLQEPPEFGPLLDPGAVLGLVGLEEADAEPALPVRVVGTGVPQVLAPVRGRRAVERCRRPDDRALADLLHRHGALVLYVAAIEGERAVARAYFPGDEDPATGSAAGPLCAYANEAGVAARLTIEQGEAVGRPSRLKAAMDGGRPRVGGEAVVVLEGEILLDA